MTKVLVVEDDPAIASEVVRGLRGQGYETELAINGAQASDAVKKSTFDMIVLDIMLPEKNGFELLDEWRARISTPILVLTARTDLDDRLRAFQKGAIDFLAKPFWMEELLARVAARTSTTVTPPSRQVTIGGCLVDLDARTVTLGGRPVAVTPHEFNLLAYLVVRPNRAVTRHQIASDALTADEDVNERTVDTHVARLRKKLGPAGKTLATVWGVGYRFSPLD